VTKLVLVKPPERSPFNFGTFSLAVLAAAVRDLAQVSILDATDLPVEEAVAEVWSQEPDWVGITVMGLRSVGPAALFLRRLATAASGFIVAGGHGASMLPQVILEAGADAVVIGEGEVAFRQMMQQGLRPDMPGVARLEGDTMITTPSPPLVHPLDDLPLPARDLMPSPPNGIHLMETSRGCPNACSFCETTRFYGKRWRPHSPRRVAAEVRRLVGEYDAWSIHFADDNFGASPVRVLRICDALQRQELPAFFMASARADDLMAKPDLLPAMASARILRITVGVESLDPAAASSVGKAIAPQLYQALFQRMRDLGIFSIASFIVGLPGETAAVRAQSVALAVEAGPDSAQFLPFLPLPGTPLAAGRETCEPAPADVRDAQAFTQAFFLHPVVQDRLRAAVAASGIRGLLARATLAKRTVDGPTPSPA
jgi:anaerobic magnesium-protoporphyrin IX monomethyl ester cyclase